MELIYSPSVFTLLRHESQQIAFLLLCGCKICERQPFAAYTKIAVFAATCFSTSKVGSSGCQISGKIRHSQFLYRKYVKPKEKDILKLTANFKSTAYSTEQSIHG